MHGASLALSVPRGCAARWCLAKFRVENFLWTDAVGRRSLSCKAKRASAPSAGPLTSKKPSPFEEQRLSLELWLQREASALRVQRSQRRLMLEDRRLRQGTSELGRVKGGAVAEKNAPLNKTVEEVLLNASLFEVKKARMLEEYREKLEQLYGKVYVQREWALIKHRALSRIGD